jgi:acyl dehydratase
LTIESSETANAPAAAIQRDTVPYHGTAIRRGEGRTGEDEAMPIQVNRAVIGKEYPPFPVTVERGKIREFAQAIGDANPFYVDERVGRASGWGDVIAPPTFPITFRDEAADTGALLRDLGVDVSRLLHGEQEFELFRPIRPGETFLVRTRITDVTEKTGRSGPMAFVVREIAVTDRANEIVATMRQVTVVRL